MFLRQQNKLYWFACLIILNLYCAKNEQADINLNPATELSFGTVSLGYSKVSTIVIQSVGEKSLHVNGVSASGESFHIESAGSFPIEVAPGRSISVEVGYRPNSVGSHQGILSISSNANGRSLAAIALVGQGEGSPVVSIDGRASSFTHNFGTVNVGQPTSHTFTLRSTGTAPVNVGN